jgi:LPS O-antigen subunit length determinant protein (WzzB/FepE family)
MREAKVMDNMIIALGIIGIVGIAMAAIYYFIKLGKEKQLEIVKEWLLYACIEAEKALGSNTGRVKLRYVYNLFISKFKYLSLIISFEQFSMLVDESLETMREMISSNKSIKDYVDSIK